MNRTTENRIVVQAHLCVRDILKTTEKNAKRTPWEKIVYDHMVKLVEQKGTKCATR